MSWKYVYYAKVISNSESKRDDHHNLLAGDVIYLCTSDNAKNLDSSPWVYYYSKAGERYSIEKENLFKIDNIPAHDVKVGDFVIVKHTLADNYGETIQVVALSDSTIFYNNYCSISFSLPIFCVEKANIRCICNFYEREAYGCSCGRILC